MRSSRENFLPSISGLPAEGDQFAYARLATKNSSPCQRAEDDRENAFKHGMAHAKIRHNRSSEIPGEQNSTENRGSRNGVEGGARQHKPSNCRSGRSNTTPVSHFFPENIQSNFLRAMTRPEESGRIKRHSSFRT